MDQSSWPEAQYLGVKEHQKVLGVWLSLNGRTDHDMVCKRQALTQQLSSRSAVWAQRGVPREQKLSLAHKVSLGSLWSSPLWALTVKNRQTLKGVVDYTLRVCAKLPRYWQEPDSKHEKRCAIDLNAKKRDFLIPDIDVVALVRVYSFLGHLVRSGAANPRRLSGIILATIANSGAETLLRTRTKATAAGCAPGHMSTR